MSALLALARVPFLGGGCCCMQTGQKLQPAAWLVSCHNPAVLHGRVLLQLWCRNSVRCGAQQHGNHCMLHTAACSSNLALISTRCAAWCG